MNITKKIVMLTLISFTSTLPMLRVHKISKPKSTQLRTFASNGRGSHYCNFGRQNFTYKKYCRQQCILQCELSRIDQNITMLEGHHLDLRLDNIRVNNGKPCEKLTLTTKKIEKELELRNKLTAMLAQATLQSNDKE